jgi:tetratricopeptide (TPR) repeat protein
MSPIRACGSTTPVGPLQFCLMSHHFDRALVLLEQSRHELAEKEIRLELAEEPNHARAHALLALCLAKREQFTDATEEARQAIALAPDDPYPHYVLASVLHDRHRLDDAVGAIEEAIRLDPQEADYWSLLAGIRIEQRRWRPALEAAEKGLELDAEHVGCNNLRALALVKLGRKAEAGATIDASLARDPENAVTHANMGWTCLHAGDSKKALEHFRTALRIDPESEWARSGIVEALKARNFIYAWMLCYFLWMGKLSGRAQWLIIIGGFLGYRVLRSMAAANPDLAPWLWPIIVLYIAFALLTWLADPLFNLLLRLNRFGKLALSRDQIVASNWIGGVLFIAILSLVAWLITGEFEAMMSAFVFGALAIPLAGTFACQRGWPRTAMGFYTATLAAVGVTALGIWVLARLLRSVFLLNLFLPLLIVFFVGAVLAQWVALIFMRIQPKK